MRILFVVVLVAGCGDANNNGGTTGGTTGSPAPNASCDTRTQNNACQEYLGTAAVIQPYKDACVPNGGTWKDGPCDKAGTVGGCKTYDAAEMLTYTNWFF